MLASETGQYSDNVINNFVKFGEIEQLAEHDKVEQSLSQITDISGSVCFTTNEQKQKCIESEDTHSYMDLADELQPPFTAQL